MNLLLMEKQIEQKKNLKIDYETFPNFQLSHCQLFRVMMDYQAYLASRSLITMPLVHLALTIEITLTNHRVWN